MRWAAAVAKVAQMRRVTESAIHPQQRILDREVAGRRGAAVARVAQMRRAIESAIHPQQRILDREVGGGCCQGYTDEESDRKRHPPAVEDLRS